MKVSYNAKNIYSIKKDFFENANIKYLIVDLDNTLDSAYTKTPSKRVFELKNMLQSLGIEMIIISNNHLKRVSLLFITTKVLSEI